MQNKLYIYTGPVLVDGQYWGRIDMETWAPTAEKAFNNIRYKLINDSSNNLGFYNKIEFIKFKIRIGNLEAKADENVDNRVQAEVLKKPEPEQMRLFELGA